MGWKLESDHIELALEELPFLANMQPLEHHFNPEMNQLKIILYPTYLLDPPHAKQFRLHCGFPPKQVAYF